MTFRDIYRAQSSLRGIPIKEQVDAELWADERAPLGAFLMDQECPPHMTALMTKLFGELIDNVFAPLRNRQ